MTSQVSPREKEWVKGLLDSRETSFRTVYEAYQRPVYAYAYYLTKSRDRAEEVTQEVFIRLWEKRRQLSPDTFLLSFLKKVTQNLVLDFFRKANADKNLADRIFFNMTAAGAEAQNPDKVLEKELAAIYIRALDQLPPQQRLVFSMRRDENLSYQQIADALGLSKNTVRNHLMIATRSIRHYVEENADLGFLLVAILLGKNIPK